MRTLAEEVRLAMDAAQNLGRPFTRRDVLDLIPGSVKEVRPGTSIGSQIDRELTARRNAKHVELVGSNSQGKSLWVKVARPESEEYTTAVPPAMRPEDAGDGERSVDAPMEADRDGGPPEGTGDAMAAGADASAPAFDDAAMDFDNVASPANADWEAEIVQVRAWRTSDGKLHYTPEEAAIHQDNLNLKNRIEIFMETEAAAIPAGRALILAWEAWNAERNIKVAA